MPYASDVFALRTPLLAFDELQAWSRDLSAAGIAGDAVPGDAVPGDAVPDVVSDALAADRILLRDRLRALVDRPEIREALLLASPSLERSLAAWRRDPESKKGRRAEQALVRYLARMASRATPFGLFSGCSLGSVEGDGDAATVLRLAPRGRSSRHTRLDMDYLVALCDALSADRSLRRRLVLRTNSSLYRAAGRWRYVEARTQGGPRRHHLVAVDADEILDSILDEARNGTTFEEVVDRLVTSATHAEDAENTENAEDAEDAEAIDRDEAEAFAHELIDHQLLVADLAPRVTGDEPLAELVARLESIDSTRSLAASLAALDRRLDAIDRAGLGAPPGSLLEIAELLERVATPSSAVELPPIERSRLLQVDVVKPVERATLEPSLVEEVVRGVELLRRLQGPLGETPLDGFKARFRERYEQRSVPLLEALDDEIGVGFEVGQGPAVAASPLLDGFVFPSRPGASPGRPWRAREALLFPKLLEAQRTGAREISLEPAEVAALPGADAPPLPDAFHAMASLDAAGRIFLRHAGGPSGATLLGRFCHADPSLRQAVAEHLAAEEAGDPEAIYAEIVHLPQGRIGNVLLRPVLRSHEICFLARGGAPDARQIPLTDLLLSIEGDRLVLRSRRLGRRIVPRLTTAHNFHRRALGVYRFLGCLQHQDLQGGVGWSWGPLGDAPFLPRVTFGRLVLARARWRVPRTEIDALLEDDDPSRSFLRVQRWRRERALPRHVVFVEGDNELLVDLDNPLSIDAFVGLLRRRTEIVLTELFPDPAELLAEGPEGRYVHELVIPCVRPAPPRAEAPPAVEALAEVRPSTSPVASAERVFPPGSEWLYAKLYTGPSTGDGLLVEVIEPLLRALVDAGAVEHWFFLRYGDPDWHLRLRLAGRPARLAAEALPALHRATEPLLADGRLARLTLDTYVRELERYGRADGIGLAERIFHVDSVAVVELLRLLDGDADARWLLAARSIDRLLADFGLDLEERVEFAGSMKTAYAREMGALPALRDQLAARLRRERRRLDAVLEPVYDAAAPLAPAFRVLEERSRRLAPWIAALRRARDDGRLEIPWHHLVGSHVHMSTNRLVRSEGRAHELVLCDFLEQWGRSRLARRRASRQARVDGVSRGVATAHTGLERSVAEESDRAVAEQTR